MPDTTPTDPSDVTEVQSPEDTTPDHTDDGLPDEARMKIAKANREAKNLRDRLHAEATAKADLEAQVKAASDELAQFRALADASKTEKQRAEEALAAEKRAMDERIEALEKQLTQTRVAAERSAIQARYRMSDEDAADILTVSDDVEVMERLAARFADKQAADAAAARRVGNHVPNEGRTTPASSDPLREFARTAFRNL